MTEGTVSFTGTGGGGGGSYSSGQLELKQEERVACTDCKSPNLTEVHKASESTRIIRFVGVTDAVSNKHRFPHKVMEQMVNDAKSHFVLPFMPASVKEVDKATLDVFTDNKAFGFSGDPLPMRDMHITDQQRTKVGRVLNVAVKSIPDKKNGGVGRKYMEVVAEVFDPHTVMLVDRGMANKFSIGFKHKYEVVDGIKVSSYGVLDHFGFVDLPADPESVLLEAKEQKDMPDTQTMTDCIASKVAEGMSQEDATKYCNDPANVGAPAAKSRMTRGKKDDVAGGGADPIGAGNEGEPAAGESQAYNDCVQGLVALGLDQAEAERSCGTGTGDPSAGEMIQEVSDKQLRATVPAMYRKQRELESQNKTINKLVLELAKKNRELTSENKSKTVAAEVKVLMDQGRVTPATKTKVYELAMSLDEKTREAYYDTLGVVVDFEGQNKGEHSQEFSSKDLDAEAKELWGGSVDDVVADIKGKRSWKGGK